MLILAFDTATAAVTVALCDWAPGEGVAVRAIAESVDGRRHAELLIPSIASVLTEAGAAREDLSAIAVGVGPGPYTGLRVGLATARALGSALRIPVHGVCTLDVMAWQSGSTGQFVVTSDARRKEVYWARYDSPGVRAEGPYVGPPEDAMAPGLPIVGEIPGSAESVVEQSLPSAGALATLIAARLAGRPGPALVPPEPLYLRRPHANAPGPRKRVTPA